MKAVICVFLCVFDRVCVCFPADQHFISLLQWRFSLQITRKVEIAAPTASGALIATYNCHFELRGLHFLSHWSLDLFFGVDLFRPV